MRSPATAVQDPIFWSFHSGIDLVWSRWQRLHVAAGGTQTFADPTAVIWFRDRNFTVASTAKTTDFGYDYDYDFTQDGPAAAAVAMSEAVQSASILNPVKAATQFAPLLSSNGRVTLAASVQRPLTGSTVIRLGSIKVFSDKSYRIYLYLHPKDIDASTLEGSTASPYFMRLVTLWQSHHNREIEIFVRPTPKQLAEIGQGWVITLRTESVPSDEQATVESFDAQPNLLPTLELQER